MNNQKLFDLVLTTVQAQIRLAAEMTQTPITPSMIESELAAYEANKKKVFELIDRDALVDELTPGLVPITPCMEENQK